MPPTSSPESRLLFIGSTPNSGSTLLSFILDNHPQVVSLGETYRIDEFVDTDWRRCTCGNHVTECELWKRVLDGAGIDLAASGSTIEDLHMEVRLPENELHRRIPALRDVVRIVGTPGLWRAATRRSAACAREEVTNDHARSIYAHAREVTGAQVVIDSSKTPGLLKNRYYGFPDEFRLIFLTRDGRAVARSQMKREEVGMDVAARTFRRRVLNTLAVMATIPRSKIIRVRYENFCREPEAELDRVVEFAGLTEPLRDLTMRKDQSHEIGGNPHRWRQDETEIELDERWRTDLGTDDLATFDRVAGRVNRLLGYAR